MRRWLLLLLTLALTYAQTYYAPPVQDVMLNNLGLSSALENDYDASRAIQFTISNPPVHLSGSVDIAGMSFMLDNATSPEDGLAVLVARGVQAQAPGGFICNHSYYGSMTFHFKNLSSTTNFPFPSKPMPAIVAVPRDVLEAMKGSSGADELEVGLSSIIRFVSYDHGGSGCNDSDFYYSPLLPSASRNFTVYGTNKLFFLRAPVLREQWFRDNRFDTIVLSQSPLYHADILLNGNITRNLTLRTFEVVTGSYGVQEIVSNLSVPHDWSEDVGLSTPLPLEADGLSFAYVYAFNYSYDGLGQNKLSLAVNDSSLGSAHYDELLLSRMLSYNGASTEAGIPASSATSRPSAAFSENYLSSFELILGLLALLILLAFVNFWLLK